MAVDLHQEVVGVVEDYLGPAAERFIDRQIRFHLSKDPDQLAKSDMAKLIEWVKVSLALLTEDRRQVDKCAERLSQLK